MDEQGQEHIYRKEAGWQKRLFLSPLVYRYFAMLGIPLMGVVYLITYPLHKIPPSVPFLGKIGAAIHQFMSRFFACGVSTSGICDPAQRKQMRDTLERDIRFFDQRLAHRLMGHTECQEWAHIEPTEWTSKRQQTPNHESHMTYLSKAALATASLHLFFVGFWWLLAQVLNQYVNTSAGYQANINTLSSWLQSLPFGEGLALILKQATPTYQADIIWLGLLIGFFLLVSRLRPYYGKSAGERMLT